jgi:membrane associated rhomboid family serine protease
LVIYILQSVGVVDSNQFCFSPALIWKQYLQVYRIFTCAYVHGSVLHILFNLMALVSLMPMLERACGTATLLVLTVIFHITIGLLDYTLSYISWLSSVHFLQTMFPFFSCAIGFSAVLFAYLTIQVTSYDLGPQSLFGLCTISSQVYPWVLLLIIQLLWPGVSFGGHLSGILSGYLGSYLLTKTRFSFVDNAIPSFIKNLQSYKMGSGGYIMSGVLSTGQPQPQSGFTFATLSRAWNPVPQTSSSGSTQQQFPGQGRVLATGLPPSRSLV